jgi:hypothetical protein
MTVEDNTFLDTLYQNIYNNIDNIIQTYDHALNPNHNNTTLKYINQGYDVREAYTMSFMTVMLLYIQISL